MGGNEDVLLHEVNGVDSANYTHNMLETLRRIAVKHRQPVLASLLDMASCEAKLLVVSSLTSSKPCFRDGVSAVPRVPTPEAR